MDYIMVYSLSLLLVQAVYALERAEMSKVFANTSAARELTRSVCKQGVR